MQLDLGVSMSCLIHELAGDVKLLLSASSLGCPLFPFFIPLLLLSYLTFCGNSLMIASFI